MNRRGMYISPKKSKSYFDSQMNKMLKDKDFTAAQVPYILEIGDSEGISMKQLSITLGADKGLTTRVIQTLIKNGFVVNKSSSGRTYNLYLTDQGKEAYAISRNTIEETLDRLLECLDEDDIKHFKIISEKINKRLDELYEY